jgi:hypothetical protein
MMEIRQASDADLAALVTVLGQRHFFTDRLADLLARRLGHRRLAIGVGSETLDILVKQWRRLHRPSKAWPPCALRCWRSMTNTPRSWDASPSPPGANGS